MKKIKFRVFLEGEFLYWERKDRSNSFWAIVNAYELDVEQYIGNDCNGAEVFENDILRDGEETCVIKWDSKNAAYSRMVKGDVYYIGMYPYNAEIIGNIHQNKVE